MFAPTVTASLFAICLLWAGSQTVTADEQQPSTETDAVAAERQANLGIRDERWQQALKLKTDGNLEEAAQVGTEVLNLERSLFGDVHEDVAVTLQWLVTLHLNLQDMSAAETAAKDLLR